VVEHPQMRENVIDVLKVLADPRYQHRMWVEERGADPDLIETLDENISLLYDLSDVAENPHGHIGITLKDEHEALAIQNLDRVLSPLIDSLPPDIDDATVIAMPEWEEVVTAARNALQVISS
jgi:hypothetical protein